jgi:hypothetical protein
MVPVVLSSKIIILCMHLQPHEHRPELQSITTIKSASVLAAYTSLWARRKDGCPL